MNTITSILIILCICAGFAALALSSYNAGQQNAIQALRTKTEITVNDTKFSCYLKATNYKRFATP